MLLEFRQNSQINISTREVQGPTWGYPTEGAYYRDASSTDALFGIRIPFLAINAEDDPVWLASKHWRIASDLFRSH